MSIKKKDNEQEYPPKGNAKGYVGSGKNIPTPKSAAPSVSSTGGSNAPPPAASSSPTAYAAPTAASAAVPSAAGGQGSGLFDRITVPNKSDDDIRNLATANLTEFEQATRRAIESQISEADRLLRSNRESEKARGAELMRQIDTYFEQARRNADNDALRRGLARSSIAVNRSADLEAAGAERRTEATSTMLDNILEIDNELEGLGAKRERALNEFDIAYAARLTQEIQRLTEVRDRQVSEATRFNNDQLMREMQFDMDSQLNESRLATEALRRQEAEHQLASTRSAQQRAREQEQLFVDTFNHLSTLSARQARQELRDNVLLRTQLTPTQFFQLYNRFGR